MSDSLQPAPHSRSKAWLCAIINQLAFPGMGTIMAGRKLSGYVQAVLMVAGFILLVGFMLWYFVSLFKYQMMDAPDKAWLTAEYRRYGWAGLWGSVLCGISWCWALVSSIQILRGAST